MKKKALSLFLSLVLCLSLLPTAAFAAACADGDSCTSHAAAVGDEHYDTLADAVAAAKTADSKTVKLLKDISEAGISVAKDTFTTEGGKLTIDLNGHTYTATCMIELGKGNYIEIKNGTIKGDFELLNATNYDSGLIDNWSKSLTLNKVTLDGFNLTVDPSNPDAELLGGCVTLYNNTGVTVIRNGSVVRGIIGGGAIQSWCSDLDSDAAHTYVRTAVLNSTIDGIVNIECWCGSKPARPGNPTAKDMMADDATFDNALIAGTITDEDSWKTDESKLNVYLRSGTNDYYIQNDDGSFTKLGDCYYTVAFDPNGGTMARTQYFVETTEDGDGNLNSAQVNFATLDVATPTRDDHTFDGWYAAKEGGEKVTGVQTITKNTTYYAHWLKNYTITYAPGANGTGSIESGVKTEGTPFTLSSEKFTRDEHVQVGWATTDGGAKVYDLGGSYTADASVTLYPVWAKNNQEEKLHAAYRVEHYIADGNNGYTLKEGALPTAPEANASDEAKAAYKAELAALLKFGEVGKPVTGTAKEYDGYIYNPTKSETTAGGSVKTFESIDDMLVLKLYYEKVYTVTFNPNGGTVGTASAKTNAEYKLASLPTATRDGYSFDGWYTAATGGDKVTAEKTYSVNTTVYAHWTKNNSGGNSGGSGGSTQYTVTVKDSENGTVTAGAKRAGKGDTVTLTVKADEGYVLKTLTVTDNKDNTVEITAKNGGYTFKMPAADVTVTAAFEAEKLPFTDVPKNDYFYEPVKWAVSNGITTGQTAELFDPYGDCVRAQAVTFLWRAAGCPAPKSTTMPFKDVPTGSYYYDAVLWAVENGITTGVTADTFEPNTKCTRTHIVAFLFRYAASQGMEAVTLQELVSGYDDAAQVDGYALSAFNWALARGIVRGDGGKLMPNDTCTRAQIVTMLYRLLGE